MTPIGIQLTLGGDREVETGLRRVGGAMDTVGGAADSLKRAVGGLAGAFAGAISVREFVQAADAVTSLQNQLKLATGGAQQAATAYSALYDIAQRSRTGFVELGTTFASISTAAADLGVSQQRLLTVTEAIGNAVTISGTGAQAAQAALVQLGQGLASGTLRGEELNSVMEQTPRLAKALADGLGVTRGELRALGSQGSITAEQVIKALESQAAVLSGEVKSATLTVGQAFTQLQNAATRAVGDFDKAAGVTGTLASAMSGLATAIGTVGEAVRNNETAFKVVAAGVAGAGAAAAIMGTVAALGKVGGALTAIGVVLAANPAVLALLGIGAAVGGGVAVMTAYSKTADGLQRSIRGLNAEISRLEGDRAFAGSVGQTARVANIDLGIAERRKEIERLNVELSSINAGPTGTGGGRGVVNPATVGAGLAAAAADEKKLADIRRELSGVSKDYLPTLSELNKLYKDGRLEQTEYVRLVGELATKNFKKDTTGASAIKEEQNAYESLIGSINSKIAQDRLQLEGMDKLTESEKFRIKLAEESKVAFSAAHRARIEARIEELSMIEQQIALEKMIDQAQSGARGARLDLMRAQDEAKEVGLLGAALGEVRQARVDDAAAELERRAIIADGIDLTGQAAAALRDQAKSMREVARVQWGADAARGVIEYRRGIDEANKLLQVELSLMGQSEQSRNIVLEQMRIELDLRKRIAEVEALTPNDPAKRATLIAELQASAAIAKANASSRVFLEDWKESVRQYDDIFRQGFADMLNNGQDGWKSFTKSLVTTFKTTVADQIYKMFLQPFVVQVVGQFMGMTGGGGVLGALGGGGGLGGTISSAANLLSSGLNIAGMGGTGLQGLADMAYNYGLDTVGSMVDSFRYGMMDAGSWSGFQGAFQAGGTQLAGALVGSVMNGFAGYGISQLISGGYQVNPSLNMIGGVASAIPGIGPIAGVITGAINRLFGRKLKDMGLEGEFGGDTGFEGNTYQYYKGGLFRSSKTVRGELDEDLRKGLGDQFNSMRLGAAAMAETLGLGTDAIENFTASIKVSFNGLSEEEIQKALQAELDKVAESIASLTLGTDEFNRSGETAAEALTRLSGSLVAVNSVFDNLGESLYATSLAGADMASQLVDLFGGADAFGSATGSYFQNFYSPEEQRAAMQRQLEKQLGTLNLKLPDINADDARAQYRALAESMDRTTEEGRKAWAMLIQLSGAFADLTMSTEDAKKAAEERAKAEQDAAKKAAEEARKQLIDSTYGLFQRALSRDRDALSEQASAISNVISTISSSVDLLKSNARELYGTVDSTAQMLAVQGMVYIEQALAGVRGGNSITGYEGLADAISAARSGISGGNYATEFDRQRDTLVLAGQLSELGELGDLQLSVEERQLKGINAQLEALEALGDRADALVNGTEDLTDTVDGYFAKLLAILAPEKTPSTGGAAGGGSGASYGPTWGGNSAAPKYSRPISYSGGVIYQGVSKEDEQRLDQYNQGYRAFDGTGDAEGLNNWIRENNLKPSDLSALSGLFTNDWEKWFAANGIPAFAGGGAHAGGLRLVGERGWEVEATGPARIWNQQQLAQALGGGGSADVVAELRALRQEFAELRAATAATATNTSGLPQMVEQFENVTAGGNAMLIEEMA